MQVRDMKAPECAGMPRCPVLPELSLPGLLCEAWHAAMACNGHPPVDRKPPCAFSGRWLRCLNCELRSQRRAKNSMRVHVHIVRSCACACVIRVSRQGSSFWSILRRRSPCLNSSKPARSELQAADFEVVKAKADSEAEEQEGRWRAPGTAAQPRSRAAAQQLQVNHIMSCPRLFLALGKVGLPAGDPEVACHAWLPFA